METFASEVALYKELAVQLESAKDDNELNKMLVSAAKRLGISSPWGDRTLNMFMNDRGAKLRFNA